MRNKAIKKVQIAIDKMIDLQGMVEQPEEIQRILDRLNQLENSLSNGKIKNGLINISDYQ